MAEKKARYEMMVIFKPLLPDDVRKGSHKAIVDLAKKLGGEVVSADVWGKRYLAYPIMSHDEGYYIVYEVDLEPGTLSEFKEELGRVSEVLRLMLTKIEDPEEERKRLNKKVIDI